MQAIEEATDIKVFIRPKGDGPFGEDPNYDPSPESNHGPNVLIHRPDPRYVGGIWEFHYDDNPEGGGGDVEKWPGPADNASDIEEAMEHARATLRGVKQPEMAQITVQIGDRRVTVGFTGRWLVEPDSDSTRATEQGYDAGAYYGVALTGRGRIAVCVAHCNDRWPPRLVDYDTLDEAAKDMPEDILAEAAEAMGQERVVWRDI